jgi:hypothetical protein
MRLRIFWIISCFCVTSNAITLQVIGKNSEPLFAIESNESVPSNIGKISTDIFDKQKIDYDGSIDGITKLFDLGQEIEVISKTEIKAHGWCFSIDGFVPETMSDETPVLQQDSVIRWYYAFAHYKDGQWIGQCVPN